MTQGAADPDPTPSLAGHAAARVRQWVQWRPARKEPAPAAANPRLVIAALAMLIAAGPLATIGVASLLTRAARSDEARIAAALAPRLAGQRSRTQARLWLSQAFQQAGPAQALDKLATALPADAALLRVERRADGVLEMEVATSDPDALRTALHRTAAFAGLRDVQQREADGRTIVLMRQAGS